MRSIACGFCGGNLEVTPASLRRHVLICTYCDAVQRLTADGAVQAGSIPEAEPPPPEVRLHDGAGAVRIELPRPRSTLSLTRSDLVRGAISTLPVALVVAGAAELSIAALVWAGTGLAAGLLWAKLRRRFPPVTVRAGRVRSTGGFERPFAVAEVRQIYTSRSRVMIPGRDAPALEAYNVWALLTDEQRVHVAGPLDAADTALWLEEYLENRMGIAQLPVAGERGGPAAAPPDRPAAVHAAVARAPAAPKPRRAPPTRARARRPAPRPRRRPARGAPPRGPRRRPARRASPRGDPRRGAARRRQDELRRLRGAVSRRGRGGARRLGALRVL